MRTDGLNAFDEATQRAVRRLQANPPAHYVPAERPKRRAPPDQPSRRAAREWEAHRDAGGTDSAEVFALKYGVTPENVFSAAYRLRKSRRLDERA